MNTIKAFDIFTVVEGKTKVFTIQAETEQQAKDQVKYPIKKVVDLGDVGEWNDDVSLTDEEINCFVVEGKKILDEMEKEFYPAMKNASTIKNIYQNFMHTNQKHITKNLLDPIRALKNVDFMFDIDGKGTSEFSDDTGSVYVTIDGTVSFCQPDPTDADIEYIFNL